MVRLFILLIDGPVVFFFYVTSENENKKLMSVTFHSDRAAINIFTIYYSEMI